MTGGRVEVAMVGWWDGECSVVGGVWNNGVKLVMEMRMVGDEDGGSYKEDHDSDVKLLVRIVKVMVVTT